MPDDHALQFRVAELPKIVVPTDGLRGLKQAAAGLEPDVAASLTVSAPGYLCD
jgi:hypothetical protein